MNPREKIPRRALCLALAGLGAIGRVPARAGTIYRSVGPNGEVIISDQPPAGARVEKVTRYEAAPASPLPPAVLKYQDDLKKGLARRLDEAAAPRTDAPPVLLSASWCGYCKRAKQHLAARGIAYTEYDVDTPAGRQMAARLGAQSGVPVLAWKGQQLTGFSAASYDALIAAR
jgi:glutaredoxin